MSPEEEIVRGSQAQRVLADSIYKEAFDAIRERIVQQLSMAETADDKRDRLNALLIALATVHRYMEQIMTTGKMAAQQIERDRSFTERVRDKVRSVA